MWWQDLRYSVRVHVYLPTRLFAAALALLAPWRVEPSYRVRISRSCETMQTSMRVYRLYCTVARPPCPPCECGAGACGVRGVRLLLYCIRTMVRYGLQPSRERRAHV